MSQENWGEIPSFFFWELDVLRLTHGQAGGQKFFGKFEKRY